ncbi:Sulfate transporter CysZ [BD1-7 clade bacterium]|uniref:Sulfate transporter CysZ n=1 Tax=BD1-7 clade bacterium TaxID=2029982 RepID=A0A5S9MVL0_9GAMM|nr:Sulfate transporter CysZ [BD1-7 clade bacterium]
MNQQPLHPPFLMLLDGLKLVTRPGLRRYVMIPLAINLIIFASMFSWGIDLIGQWQQDISAWLPSWLSWASYILWPVYALAFWLFLSYGFITLTNIIASPFNALLSEKVEGLMGYPTNDVSGLKAFMAMVPKAVMREIQKFVASLKWLILMIVLLFIPGLNVLTILISGWLMAIQYLDYPADNHEVPFKRLLNTMGKDRFPAWGFGLSISLVSMIPLANLVIVPAAICGATCLWHEKYHLTAKAD